VNKRYLLGGSAEFKGYQGFVVKIWAEKRHPSRHANERPLWGLGELIIYKSGVENQQETRWTLSSSNTQIWNPRDSRDPSFGAYPAAKHRHGQSLPSAVASKDLDKP
jgi:hypothetical protein